MVKLIITCSSYDGLPVHAAQFISGVCERLEEAENMKPIDIITQWREVQTYFKNEGRKCYYYGDILDEYEVGDIPSELVKLEEKYDCLVERILIGDYDYNHMGQKYVFIRWLQETWRSHTIPQKWCWDPRYHAFKDMIKIFKFWEDYVEKESPVQFIGGMGRYIGLIGNIVLNRRSPEYLTLPPLTETGDIISTKVKSMKKDTRGMVMSSSPFPNTFYLRESIWGWSPELQRQEESPTQLTKQDRQSAYRLQQRLQRNNLELSHENELNKQEKQGVDEYINSIINTDKRYFQPDSTPRLNIDKLKFFLGRAQKSFFIERLKTPYSKPWRGAYNYSLKMIRSRLAKIFYDKPNYNERYIFFPLHVEWDAPLLVWNQLFINQVFLIKIIARNLPSDTTLYVKEHITDIGGMPLTHLRQIKNTPKTKLIHPQEDSHKLIKNSDIVLTIAGTAGWEALLMEKPVISVGTSYYSKLTWEIRDLTLMSDTIKKARRGVKASKEELYAFIAAFQKRIHQGRTAFTQLYYSNKSNRDVVLSEENIEKVAEGIRKEIMDLVE